VEILEIVGRVLFSLIFIASGFAHFKNVDAMTGYAKSKGLPAAKLVVMASGLLMLVGSILLISGYDKALGALLLAFFVIPTALIMHPFWKESDAMTKMNEQMAFMKDISLCGAAIVMFVLFQ